MFAWNVNRTWERGTHQYVRLKNFNAKKQFLHYTSTQFWDLKRLIQVIPLYSRFVPNLSLLSLLSSNLRSNKTNPSKASKDQKPIITYHKSKQWPLAPNSREWRITRANVSRRVTFFPEMAFGECGRVRAKQVGECQRIYRVEQNRLANVSDSDEYLSSLLMNVGSSKIAQITYFICIKRSSLHSLNLPNSLNSRKTCQTCLSQVWRVLAKWFGKCQRVWRVRAKQVGECGRI